MLENWANALESWLRYACWDHNEVGGPLIRGFRDASIVKIEFVPGYKSVPIPDMVRVFLAWSFPGPGISIYFDAVPC